MAAAAVKARALDIGTFRAYRTGQEDKFPLAASGFTRFGKAISRAMKGLGAAAPVIGYERHAPATSANAETSEDERRVTVLLIGGNPAHVARLHIEPGLVFALCDLVFGGSGTEPAYLEERPLSHIEKDVSMQFADMFAEQLPNAFQSQTLDPFTRFIPASDGLSDPPEFKAELRVTLLASLMGFSGELVVECNAALAALLAQRGPVLAETQNDAGPYSTAIVSRVEKSEVELGVILASLNLTLGELSTLQPGHVIALSTFVGKPVTIESDGVAMHQARLGQQSRRFCVSVL